MNKITKKYNKVQYTGDNIIVYSRNSYGIS